MKALRLIIAREYFSRVKTKAFILTTLLTPILMIAVMFLPAYLMTLNLTDISTVYVIDKTGMYAPLLKDAKDFKFIVLDNDNSERESGEMFALLQINADLSKMPEAVTFFSEKQKPPVEITSYINSILSNAVKKKKLEEYVEHNQIDSKAIADVEEIVRSSEAVKINTMQWSGDGETKDTVGEIASFVGMMFTLLMFMFIIMYGSLVMQSVVEEKSNRIIEVIISSVKPFYLMMGKIIGVALTGLTQVAVWIIILVAGSLAFKLFGPNISVDMNGAMDIASQNKLLAILADSKELQALFDINWLQVAICFILYFIGGYLLFASLFAMFGSAANDSQEAQQFIMPVTVLLMVAFYVGFAAARNPESSMAFWGSLIPFTSPVVMMVRTPFEIPIWEIILSLVLLYTTAILMIALAAKIYRTGILMYGKKVSFGEIFKWLSYK